MEAGVDEGLAVPFDELRAIPEEGLGDAGRHPGGIMQFHIRVGDQVAVLLEVVRDADHLAVTLDHQRLVACFLKTNMEGVLRLEFLQQVV